MSHHRTEWRNLKMGVATVAAEFVLERLRSDQHWKKRFAELEGKLGSKEPASKRRKGQGGPVVPLFTLWRHWLDPGVSHF